MSAKTQQERTEKAEARYPFGTPIEDVVAAEVKKQLQALNGHAPKFSVGDERFLIWVLGFTAGANLERDGQRGERIFAWCRDLHDKMMQGESGNPS